MTPVTALVLWLSGSLVLAGLLSVFLERPDPDDDPLHRDDHLLGDFKDLGR